MQLYSSISPAMNLKDPEFVSQMLRSLYVDDLSLSLEDGIFQKVMEKLWKVIGKSLTSVRTLPLVSP